MNNKNPIGRYTFGVFLCLLYLPATLAEPFLTQDQNPFSLVHGQPQPVSAQLPQRDSLEWSLTLDITNSLNVEFNSREDLFMDYESYHLRFGLHYGLNENWALRLDVPYIHYGGGFLDNSVDNWHDTFGLPQGDRPNVANDQFSILYSRNGMPVIDLTTSDSGPGDIQFGIGRKITHTKDLSLSMWASIDLPTGDVARLTGNDASDIALLLAGSYRLHDEWSTDANLGILFPGEKQVNNIAVENNVVFGYAGVQWTPYSLFDLRIQFTGHSGYYANSQLLLLSETYNIVFGGRVHISECSDFDIAVSEDIKVGATPDVSFLFTWKSKLGDCASPAIEKR